MTSRFTWFGVPTWPPSETYTLGAQRRDEVVERVQPQPHDPNGSTVRTLTGPSDFGIIGEPASSRVVGPGDVVIIPAGIAHGFSSITETITYLVVRIDPDKLVELK